MKNTNDNLRRSIRFHKDHKKKKFIFQIAKISFVKFPILSPANWKAELP